MELDKGEALRYLGVGGAEPPEEVLRMVDEAAALLDREGVPRYTYRVFPLEHRGGAPLLGGVGIALEGNSARLMLEECESCVVLAATLGARFDALLRQAQARDMARAVVLDACGSAGVEWACDRAEDELRARFPQRHLTDRFSPGYGDLPLDLQRPLCAALDAQRRLGLYVTDSRLLNPGKSVTALVGLADRPQKRRIRGCACCSMASTCTLRKEGKRCAP